jgi:hypothetical protein
MELTTPAALVAPKLHPAAANTCVKAKPAADNAHRGMLSKRCVLCGSALLPVLADTAILWAIHSDIVALKRGKGMGSIHALSGTDSVKACMLCTNPAASPGRCTFASVNHAYGVGLHCAISCGAF